MTKEENLNDPKSCLSKADMKEPIFVLRANDPIAPAVIRIWASLSNETQPADKRAKAYFESVKFEEWRKEKYPHTDDKLDDHSHLKGLDI